MGNNGSTVKQKVGLLSFPLAVPTRMNGKKTKVIKGIFEDVGFD